jgi:hypothetical protein
VEGPYRNLAVVEAAPPRASDPEASIIYGLLALVGGARLGVAYGLEEAFHAEATVALVFVILGVLGYLGALLRR